MQRFFSFLLKGIGGFLLCARLASQERQGLDRSLPLPSASLSALPQRPRKEPSPLTSELTGLFQAYRPELRDLYVAVRTGGDPARFQAQITALPSRLSRAVRDDLLSVACLAQKPSAPLIEALVVTWSALPTQELLKEVDQKKLSKDSLALLEQAWQAAKELLDQAAGTGDLAGVQRGILRGIMPDLTTFARALLADQQEVLSHLAPYGLSAASFQALGAAWELPSEALYATLLLTAAQGGEEAVVQLLIERLAPGLLEDQALFYEALSRAIRGEHLAIFQLLMAHYKEHHEVTPQVAIGLLKTALTCRTFEVYAAVRRNLPPVDKLEKKAFAQAFPYKIVLPILQDLVSKDQDLVRSMGKQDLRLWAATGNGPVLSWLMEQYDQAPHLFPQLDEDDLRSPALLTSALASGDAKSIALFQERCSGSPLTEELLAWTLVFGSPELFEWVVALPRERPWEEYLPLAALGDLVSRGELYFIGRLKELAPDLFPSWREKINRLGYQRYFLRKAIYSGQPDMVAWLASFLAKPWGQDELQPMFQLALTRASQPLCQVLLALMPGYQPTAQDLDYALAHQDPLLFDWLYAYCPDFSLTRHTLACLQGYGSLTAWVRLLTSHEECFWGTQPAEQHPLYGEALRRGGGAHLFEEALRREELATVKALARLGLPLAAWQRCKLLEAIRDRGESQRLFYFLQAGQGLERQQGYRATLLAHDQPQLPLDLADVVMGYLGSPAPLRGQD